MRQRILASALFVLLLSQIFFGYQLAQADQSVTYAQANFSGAAYLNSTSDLQIDITPLVNGSDTWRYLNFAWGKDSDGNDFSAQVGVDVYASGTQHNFVLSFYGAVDQKVMSGSGNSVSCDKRNPFQRSGKSYFQAVCWTPYTLSPGHTFRIRVYNNAALGPTWFNASFDDLTTKTHLEIGSIDVGDRKFSSPLSFTQYGMGDLQSNPDCSKVGINDTIFSGVKSGGNVLNSLSSQAIGSCLNAVIVPNSYPLGGNVLKFGGVNPELRNLESTATLNSSLPQQIRIPRSVGTVPRPADVNAGLVQTRYQGYFADRTEFFNAPVASNDVKIIDSFPEYFFSSGPAPIFSNAWTGYFIPDYTGAWTFKLTTDDAGYFWIGDNAVTKYQNDVKSADINLGGVHAFGSREATVNLIKDKVYPLRLMYGNALDVSVFKFEFKAPGFNYFDSDFSSLLWHSTPSSCSNWGMSYVVVGDLGFEKIDLSRLPDCKDKYASQKNDGSSTIPAPVTPISKPTFSLVNFVNNKVNISVNVGSDPTNRPDTVYLVAPKLGLLDSNKALGTLNGSNASWSIDFDKILAGTSIPLKVIAVKSGQDSVSTEESFAVPKTSTEVLTNKLPPAPAKNIKYRIVGSSIVISAEATIKVGALATKSFVFGPSINRTKAKSISGDIVGNKVLLEIPLSSSMAGKKLPVFIYLANDAGESSPVQTSISVPSAPKTPTKIAPTPTKPVTPKTVFCVKGSQTRAFAAKNCPPGWKSA